MESILKHLSNNQNVSPLFAASKRETNLVWDGKFWTKPTSEGYDEDEDEDEDVSDEDDDGDDDVMQCG